MPTQISNQRIAKNTVLLYIRTLVVMVITLYTSRVVLSKLGVNDYGIYQVVGGFVAMFSVISSALSTSISRFITYELGRGDNDRLRAIFSTSINIQIGISLVVIVACELFGVWFLNTKMSIPPDRLTAANWVLHCSLLTFCVNLLSVPYNACIVAHEKMTVFAYISVLEAVLKLVICYLITLTMWDKLTVYALLMLGIAIIIRFIYAIYCRRHFQECYYVRVRDKRLLRNMTSFAGWSFFTSFNSVLNNYGVNLLINIYFGIAFNAARGIATQVENAVTTFVTNFTTALNPQITKGYASGEKDAVYTLVCRGTKFSFYAMLMMTLPLIFETEMVLNIWLEEVPPFAVVLSRLSLILGIFDCIGTPGATACYATGNIKKYAIFIGIIGLFVFPLTWLFFSLGASVLAAYYVYIVVKFSVFCARVFLQKKMVNLEIKRFVKEAVKPMLIVTCFSIIPSYLILCLFEPSYPRLLLSITVGALSVGGTSLLFGMNIQERDFILNKIKSRVNKR